MAVLTKTYFELFSMKNCIAHGQQTEQLSTIIFLASPSLFFPLLKGFTENLVSFYIAFFLLHAGSVEYLFSINFKIYLFACQKY